MLIAINTVSQTNQKLDLNNNIRKLNNSVTTPAYDTVSFKANPLTTKQALKFLIPITISGLGLMQYMPKFVTKKLLNIELEEHEHEFNRIYGTINEQHIDSHMLDIRNLINQNPNKIKIIEKLLRNNIFCSLVSTNYLAQNNPELLDKQLKFLDRMVDIKEYHNYIDAGNLRNYKTNNSYTLNDYDAKHKMCDYILDFNKKYKNSPRWNQDKLCYDIGLAFRRQVEIINATNAFNLDLMLEMVKTKTTFIDSITPPNEIKAADLPGIGMNINERNIDYVRKLFRDKNVARGAIVGLSEWIEKKSMQEYRKLKNNPNIPKKFVGDIGSVINDFNHDFVMSLAQNENMPKDDIAQIGKFYNEYSAPTLKYLIKHIQDERIMHNRRHIWAIGSSINAQNKMLVERLCRNEKIALNVISEVDNVVNEDNLNLVEQMCVDNKTDMKYILECAYKVTKKNKQIAEKLYSQYQITNKKLATILENLYILEKIPSKNINFAKKFAILNLQAKYGYLMKECGFDFEDKILKIANSINNEKNCMQPKNLREFLFQILANNNSEAENIMKTYDFAKFGKNGIPLKYARKDFIENLEENILSGVKAEDRRTILDNFGIMENSDYDGLWNNQKIDKSKLISEKGRIASEKVLEELNKFMLENSVVSDDNRFNKIINSLIKGLPSFTQTIGKVQHDTHDYSVDIHTLKVLQSCLNNPMYDELSNEGKTILKLSALLHDIGKNGNVRDPGHADKSAEYAKAILKKIKLPKDVKERIINIIVNHHWFANYNVEKDTPNNIATKCRLKEDFLIYQILAKADLENVSNSFHLKVTDTQNQKEYNTFFAEKMEKINEAMNKLHQNANIIFHTKILNNGNKFPIQKVKLKDGTELKLKVLNINDLPNGASLEPYGFPKGTTKENARFLVHMTETGTNFDVARTLIESPQNNSTWSTSLISAQNNGTYCNMVYGFIFDVNQKNISEANYKNTCSGTHKKLKDFEETLFDFKNPERTYVRNNLKKELRMHGIWLSDKEYGDLVNYLEKKKHISAIRNNVKIGNRTINAKTLVKCLEKSRDSLFKDYWKYVHNEVVVINPKIQGLVAKNSSIEDCNEDFLIFAHKHNLPIILFN